MHILVIKCWERIFKYQHRNISPTGVVVCHGLRIWDDTPSHGASILLTCISICSGVLELQIPRSECPLHVNYMLYQ